MKGKLLIVEDDDHLRLSFQEYFEKAGFEVTVAEDGVIALTQLNRFRADVIILDVELPHKDGLEVTQAIRQQSGYDIDIIMISGVKKHVLEQSDGLEQGADVYFTKPIETRLLLAQVRTFMSRRRARFADGWTVVDDHLSIHLERREVTVSGEEVKIQPLEFRLLDYLAQRQGKICTNADIMETVWQDGIVTPDSFSQSLMRLRKIIETEERKYIHNKRGFGYLFEAQLR